MIKKHVWVNLIAERHRLKNKHEYVNKVFDVRPIDAVELQHIHNARKHARNERLSNKIKYKK